MTQVVGYILGYFATVGLLIMLEATRIKPFLTLMNRLRVPMALPLVWPMLLMVVGPILIIIIFGSLVEYLIKYFRMRMK